MGGGEKMNIILVMMGGALGASSRYYCTLLLVRYGKDMSFSILWVNIFASFIAGIILVLVLEKITQEPIRLFLLVGFAGAFSTMSALSVETVQLINLGEYLRAGSYIMLNIVGSLIAIFSGMSLVRFIFTTV